LVSYESVRNFVLAQADQLLDFIFFLFFCWKGYLHFQFCWSDTLIITCWIFPLSHSWRRKDLIKQQQKRTSHYSFIFNIQVRLENYRWERIYCLL